MIQNIVDAVPLGGIVTVRDRLLAMQAAGRPILRLESGDPSFEVPPHVREAVVKALHDGRTHYTQGAGIPEFRRAAVEKLRRENGIPVADHNRVLVTNGAMHGLYVAFRSLLDPGDEVIIPDPTWTETADNITLAHGIPVRCRLDGKNGFKYDASTVEGLITRRTRAIVVNTPHNPTGAVLDRGALGGLLDAALRHGLMIISDEAYEHVIFDGHEHVSIGSLPGAEKNVVSIFSLSKSYAMSGLRLGYLACNDDKIVERMVKLLRCTINGVNSATQWGGVAALTGPQHYTHSMREIYMKRRDILMKGLRSVPFLEPVKPSGAFYVWTGIKGAWPGCNADRSGWAMTNHLIDQAGVGSSPGEVFGPAGQGYVRFAFSCSTEQIEMASEILKTRFGSSNELN